MISITDYILDVYNDFSKYVEKNNGLCALKELNYEAGKTPDYSNIHIQQLYLLRYAFAYAFEYKSMYETLFLREKYDDEILVTSIGCGNMMDYWGLVDALERYKSRRCSIEYVGIDIIDWNYKIKPREKDSVEFIHNNVISYFQKNNIFNFDIFVFPMSISEFSDEEFQCICDSFQRNEMQKDKIHVLISLRGDEWSLERDRERSKKIVEALSTKGFVAKEGKDCFYKLNNVAIKALDNKYVYPDEAKELLRSLDTKCDTIYYIGESCSDECKKMNRQPILMANNICYQVLSFEKSGEAQ